ncbi:hypothetical protein [Solibacillus isronensis]|uniref:hypothetical protein n=1 Tax=Solibacillus isronensis TaxID=412383 RepID=UPI0039A33695
MQRIRDKDYRFKGFGLRYTHVLTEENETIKGGSLFLFGKQCVTFAISNTDWVDDNGKPYKFKLERHVLFIKKWAIGFNLKG